MALMLENTFLSIPAMVDTLMPYVRHFKSLILRISWASDKRIGKITQPIFFISGTADELVPPSHMDKLYKMAIRSKKPVLLRVPGGTHNDTMVIGGIAYYRAMLKFIEEVLTMLEGSSSSTTTSSSSGNGSNGEKQVKEGVKEQMGAIPLMPKLPGL